MLVLSRKEDQKVLFPTLGIAVQILRHGGGKVRIGIEAPEGVGIVRHEIASQEQLDEFARRLQRSATHLNHAERNRLQSVILGLCLVQKQLSRNMTDDAEETLAELIAQMQGLDGDLKVGGGRFSVEQLRPSRRRALLVEDNFNEQRLLASYLALSGYEVDTVDDGMKALDYLASHAQPDAVVMDMQLPRLGGAAAVGVLRSDPRYRGLKVFAVSGMDRRDAHVPIGPEGVNHWFAKPLDPQQLVERMNAELEPAVV